MPDEDPIRGFQYSHVIRFLDFIPPESPLPFRIEKRAGRTGAASVSPARVLLALARYSMQSLSMVFR